MKKFIVAALTCSLLAGQVYAFQSPDILIDTRLDADWSGILMGRVRKLMKNYGQPDPFRQKFKEPITVSEGLVKDFLNPQAKELLLELGHLLDMDFLNGQTQVTMHGFQYEIRGFKTEIQGTEELEAGISIASDFSANKVQVKAEKVVLSLVMPGKKALPVINIEVLKPVISAYEKNLVTFSAQLQIQDHDKMFKLFLEKADFSTLANNLVGNDESIILDVAGINVPNVSIKVGNKELKFDPKKIEALILSRKEGIKGLLVAQVSSLLTGGLANEKMKLLNNVSFKKEHWIDSTTLQSMIRMASFQGNTHGKSLQVTLDGDFCSLSNYTSQNTNCPKTRATQPAKTRLTQDSHDDSMNEVNSLFDQGDANIVVSISEDYVNKALAAAYDAGLLNSKLEKAGVMLGPNKLFIRMDKKGSNTGTLYMDVLYTPKKLERMAIGSKEVRFPLAIQVGLKIKTSPKGIPTFILHMSSLDTSDEMLLKGKPEFGVVSNINKLRFKKKVLDSIRMETVGIENQDIFALEYPKLRGLGLDKIDFVSDGNGRMNALILLRNTLEQATEAIK